MIVPSVLRETTPSVRRVGSRRRPLIFAALLFLASAKSVGAQPAPAPAPPTIGGVTVTGSIRSRSESWNWFGTDPNGDYTFLGTLIRIGIGQVRKPFDWNVELAVPVLAGLPKQPPGAGPAGHGATYFVANNRHQNAASLFPKQAYVRVKHIGGVSGASLRFGRMEFVEGSEPAPPNETLAAVKRDRIGARLLANFGFTHVQRSIDGVQFVLDRPTTNVTAVAGRLTQGVFQVNGWGELDVSVAYGALSRRRGDAHRATDWRLFGLGYFDARDGVVKTDNRPLSARQSDREHVNLGTFGGHYLAANSTNHGTIDVLLWGVVQVGSWGVLSHRADAFAVEAGWQPHVLLAPWFRGGIDRSTGDSDPNDSTHGTFFQVAPTARVYARFPFFNLMNSTDLFGEVVLRPSKRLSTRSGIHSLQVTDRHDLWYQGGGAYQPSTFGFSGLPVGGNRALATLFDSSVDFAVTRRASVGVYYGHAAGGSASAVNYPTSNGASLGFAELLIRF